MDISEQVTSRGLSFELELPKFQADTKGLQFKWAKGEQSEGKQKEQKTRLVIKEELPKGGGKKVKQGKFSEGQYSSKAAFKNINHSEAQMQEKERICFSDFKHTR